MNKFLNFLWRFCLIQLVAGMCFSAESSIKNMNTFLLEMNGLEERFWMISESDPSERSDALRFFANEVQRLWRFGQDFELDEICEENFSGSDFCESFEKLIFYKAIAESRLGLSSYSSKVADDLLIYAGQFSNLSCFIYYSVGLMNFRRIELGRGDPDFSLAQEYLEKAVSCEDDFPEAYWLLSQIYAINGYRDKVIMSWVRIRDSEIGLRPEYYLFDEMVYQTILKATSE